MGTAERKDGNGDDVLYDITELLNQPWTADIQTSSYIRYLNVFYAYATVQFSVICIFKKINHIRLCESVILPV